VNASGITTTAVTLNFTSAEGEHIIILSMHRKLRHQARQRWKHRARQWQKDRGRCRQGQIRSV
jgi:hypothetical protein